MAAISIAPQVVMRRVIAVTPVSFDPDSEPDPDAVGPCPVPQYAGFVVRRSLDDLGRPTWFCRDGSILRRETRIEDLDGTRVEVPVIVILPPRAVAVAPAVSSDVRGQ